MTPTAVEYMIRGACCLHCRTAAVMWVRDEEGDAYQKCLACGRHNLQPARVPPAPRHAPHRSTRQADAVASNDSGCNRADSGCAPATRYLGRPSRCLACPFSACLQEERLSRQAAATRRRRVVRLLRQGRSRAEVACLLKLTPHQVRAACQALAGRRA